MQQARQICAACLLADSCRTWAREQRVWGVWGGETNSQRAAAGFPPDEFRGRGLPSGQRVRDYRPCGTRAAHRRHLRRGEEPCEACRAVERRR
ncbi:WhiB family transcriptional regulator [Streptomyces sp. N35]|uniref:WhiB family transcriptional regulator n=1 Tax=Streptomyces sp. N35 TaxID=2795730 RepID=UPI0018F649B5